MHKSSVPNARWAHPIGWEPTQEIEGAEFLDGSWWSDSQEEAGLICFVPGVEGAIIEVDGSDLRIVTTGDCRVIGEIGDSVAWVPARS
jgi:hypothetical protein